MRLAVLLLSGFLLTACGATPTPALVPPITPDASATKMAMFAEFAATLTAEAPTLTATVLPTAAPTTPSPSVETTATTAPTPTPSPTPTASPTPDPTSTNIATTRPTFTATAIPTVPEPAPSPTPLTYAVQAGDSLSKIAARFGVSLEVLLAHNEMDDPSKLYVGQVLQIPSEDDKTAVPIATVNPEPLVTTATATRPAAPTPTPIPTAAESVMASMDPLSQMELAFVGGYTRAEIKVLLDKAMTLYGVEITDDNYSRAGSVLVGMRLEYGVPEMDILEYMIRSYVEGVSISFPEMAAIATIAILTGDG